MRILAMTALACALAPGLSATAEARSQTAELPRIKGHDEAAA